MDEVDYVVFEVEVGKSHGVGCYAKALLILLEFVCSGEVPVFSGVDGFDRVWLRTWLRECEMSIGVLDQCGRGVQVDAGQPGERWRRVCVVVIFGR